MGSREIATEELSDRLIQLERRILHIKRAGVGFFITIALALAAGANRGIPETIEAHEFLVRNADGQLVAALMADPIEGGGAALRLFDPRPKGVEQAVFSMHSLWFNGAVRKGTDNRIVLGLVNEDQFGMTIRDVHGTPRLLCGVGPETRSYFKMNDHDQQPRVSIEMDKNDTPVIALRDPQGDERAVLSTRADGNPALNLFRLNGQVSLEVGGEKDGPARVQIVDKDGKVLASIIVGQDGRTDLKGPK